MIKAPQLLADLTRLLKRLEEDLLRRIDDVTELKASLQAEWQAARNADRTAETFETWVDQVITQAGVHWLLSCVFLRFIEDNKLVDRPWLGGTPESGNLALARDRHEAYFRANPLHSDREYLLASFREAGTLSGLHTFFDEGHNPVFRLGISGDAAIAVRQFWQQVDPNTGALAHDFTDPTWNTRFLGDLYQDLSEATRKRYALLQTPEFVEEFILDRTLTPAIREFGYRTASLIDPTCGSGHFLLGAFHRFVDEWQRAEPSRNRRDIVQKALDAVAGVDLNPFAVAISRFRLLVAALLASDVHKLNEAPDFRIHVAIGDSLLHGKRFGMTATEGMFEGAEHYAGTGLAHAYASEDLSEVQRILGRQYHAVVGNPPYIIVKDAALNAAYRQKYASCHMKYSLGAPFTERFFELALSASVNKSSGFIGLITSDSFMKREFGTKLIERVLARLDLTHVVSTSGAHIPGHGTPTVILFGRHRFPVGDKVRTVMGIKGEPTKPGNPARGLVWSAILDQIDFAGSEGEFITVADVSRAIFSKHPWSIGGGGAADLREQIEKRSAATLGAIAAATGVMVVTGEDDIFVRRAAIDLSRDRVPSEVVKQFIEGDAVRDWAFQQVRCAIYEYDGAGRHMAHPSLDEYFWIFRGMMRPAIYFSRTKEQRGMHWREYGVIVKDKLAVTPTIAFAEVATHTHFVLDLDGRVFKNSVQVIKLPIGTTQDEHLGLLGLLNSSVACFWFQQVCHNKGGPGGGSSKDEKWHDFYAFNSTKVAEFPLIEVRPLKLAKRLDTLARQFSANQPANVIANSPLPSRDTLDAARERATRLRRCQIATQEELDWHCYGFYSLLPTDVKLVEIEHVEPLVPLEVNLGERAFEIVMARRMAAGTIKTKWFEWLGITPIVDLPMHWTESYRSVVSRRIELIERDRNIGLMESPASKRRWESATWEDQEQAALKDWLLARLESRALWVASTDQPPQINTTSRLADTVQRDAEFMQIAALYAGHAGFDVAQLVAGLVTAESVPFLPSLRYSDTGLRKRAQWEDTWTLQRREDAIDAEVVVLDAPGWLAALNGEARTNFKLQTGVPLTASAQAWVDLELANEIKRHQDERKTNEVGPIPVPPKYQNKDFLKADFWRLRGGLDLPKERWVSYPGCERGADTSLPIAWAGWNHLQQATALAAYYLEMKESEGWDSARLQPLLAGLLELVPWLEQWHNDVDPVYGERMGAYYKGFVSEEARSHGFTLDDLRAWKPAAMTTRRARKKASAVSEG